MVEDLGFQSAADNLLAPRRLRMHIRLVTVADPPTPLTALRHELRTPLAAVIGFADAMRVRAFGPLSEPYVECAEAIDKAARHMLDLVDRLADGGPDAPERQLVDAGEVVSDAILMLQPIAEARQISLNASLPDSAVMVAVKPTHLRQVAINLIANAAAAATVGGWVKVELGLNGGDLILTVEDSGFGPPGDSQDGVGLQLVRSLCAVYDGAFELGRGSAGARAVARLRTG
jgi:signal transduction histidine kinase